jgi:hypothetical protein
MMMMRMMKTIKKALQLICFIELWEQAQDYKKNLIAMTKEVMTQH